MPAQSCVNCHFLVKQLRDMNGREYPVHPTQEERQRSRKDDFEWVKPCGSVSVSLTCHHGVWDEGYNFDKERRHDEIVRRNRKGFCFFLEYHEGMLFPAGEEIQRLREASRDRRLTVSGLWIAAIALVASTIVGIIGPCTK